MRGSSSTAHSTVINSTASTEKLDRNSTARQTSTGRHMESASTGLDGARQELDRLDKARQARPRQRPRQRLDGASTARQLDSQGSSSCIEYSAIRCGSAAVPAGAGTRQLKISITVRGTRATAPREIAGCCLTRTPVGRVRSRDRPGFKMKIKFDSAQSRPQSQVRVLVT